MNFLDASKDAEKGESLLRIFLAHFLFFTFQSFDVKGGNANGSDFAIYSEHQSADLFDVSSSTSASTASPAFDLRDAGISSIVA